MYIGSTDIHGLNQLVYEIVDNSVDEAMAGFGQEINVTIHEDNSVTVQDFGRGCRQGCMPQAGQPLKSSLLSHAGGKFTEQNYRPPAVCTGRLFRGQRPVQLHEGARGA